MKIGILETGRPPQALEEEFGDYGDLFARLLDGHGFTFEHWHVTLGEVPTRPDQADGWLITGSRHGVYDDLPWIEPMKDFVRASVATETPIVGICFGHQLMAEALGGRAEKFDGGWAAGHQRYDTGNGPLDLLAWHQDQVTELPPGAEVLASNAFCAYAAISYGPGALSYQAHPEYTPEFFLALSALRGPGVVPDAQLTAARASAGTPLNAGEVADALAEALKTKVSA